MGQFEDTVVSSSNAARGGSGAPTAEVIQDGASVPAHRAKGGRTKETTGGGQFDQVVETAPIQTNAATGGRILSDSTRSLIEKMISEEKSTGAADPDDPDEPEEPAQKTAPAEAAADPDDPDDPDAPETPPKPVAKAAPNEWETERATLRSELDKHKADVQRLTAEVERAKQTSADPARERLKRLDEAEDTYVRDPIAAHKAWLASVNGFDPTSKEFEKEYNDFFVDLTSAMTGVTPDSNYQSERRTALIRREWDKQKKQAPTDTQKPTEQTAPSEQSGHAGYLPIVTEMFAPVAKDYPELARLAKAIHGRSPEDVLAEVIHDGFKSGTFKTGDKDADVIAKAAELAETYYKRRRDEILGTDTSTARTPDAGKPDATVDTGKVERQGKGSRVTNAAASVAPSTPPANKPSETAKPAFKSEADRKRYALRHLRK